MLVLLLVGVSIIWNHISVPLMFQLTKMTILMFWPIEKPMWEFILFYLGELEMCWLIKFVVFESSFSMGGGAEF